MVRIAALQPPLAGQDNNDESIATIRQSVVQCEAESIDILCCPEAFLGGLADQSAHPFDLAINASNGELERILAPLSGSVAVIVGFTELAAEKIYNSAAVYFNGSVIGIYRKMRPAINSSVYRAGRDLPVFEVKGLKFGIQICNDSNFPEQTAKLANDGARVLFVPSNNALPPEKADVVELTREVDISLAFANSICVVRSDVTGTASNLTAHGTSKIVDPTGQVLTEAASFQPSLIQATI